MPTARSRRAQAINHRVTKASKEIEDDGTAGVHPDRVLGTGHSFL